MVVGVRHRQHAVLLESKAAADSARGKPGGNPVTAARSAPETVGASERRGLVRPSAQSPFSFSHVVTERLRWLDAADGWTGDCDGADND